MERKDKVLNLRVTDRQRSVYERAAAPEGTSVSAQVTASMTVPADVFDGLLAALDQPVELAPSLKEALAGRRFENR